MTSLHVASDDLDDFARAMRQAADGILIRNVGAELARVGQPIGTSTIRDGAEEMPHGGGLSALIASQGRVDVDVDIRSRLVEVGLGLEGGANLAALDRGELRHKVFDRPEREVTWVDQTVPERAFTRALERQLDTAVDAAQKGVEQTLHDIARKA